MQNPVHEDMSRLAGMDVIVVVLLVIAGVLLCSNLDNGYLWQDEAETALLARSTLKFGYPTAFDGKNMVYEPTGYGPGAAWIYNPWVSFYTLAGVFAVLGESTWVARLPFAILGWLSIYLTWRLARALTGDRCIHRLSVALLTFSVPFLLHMRQCRYYATTTAVLLGVSLAYLAFLRRPSVKRALWMALLLALLFHTNFATFVPAFASLILHQVVWAGLSARRCVWLTVGVVLVLVVPWAVFFYRPGFVGTMTLERMSDHLEYYIRVMNKYLLPLAAILVTSVVAWMLRWRPVIPAWTTLAPGIRAFLPLFLTAQLAFFVLVPDQRHLRYVIPLLPLLAMIEAMWLAGWLSRSRWLGWAVAGLALFTNSLQSSHVTVPLARFVDELTHQYVGPMDGVVNYLRAHGRPGQVAKIPYDDRTLMFYTPLKVENPATFLQESYPDWVVIRRDWVPAGFFDSEYFRRIEATYDRIELDAPDIQWQNREDPGSHHFRTVQDAPRVVIYRKRAASASGRLG